MSAPKIPVPVTMTDVFGWLNELEESHLHSATRQLIERMNVCVTAQDFENAWKIQDEILKFLRNSLDAAESTEILTCCGRAAFLMCDETQATKLLKNAVYADNVRSHKRAVASWMLGSILWLFPYPHMHDAIISWQESIDIFNLLSKQRTTSESNAKWYKQHIVAMEESLSQVVAAGGIPPTRALGETRPHYPAVPLLDPVHPGPKLPSSGPRSADKRHRVRSFPVFGVIPAGNLANVAAPSESMEVDEVILDEARHRIVSLKRGVNTVNLADGRGCFVLKVSGTSMNKAEPEPIENGDYVLLRIQKTAENGDIVAAEIVGLDDRATLKRYSVENGKIVLMPESRDPAFQNPILVRREFTTLDDDFHIRGIALAVLKRIEA